MMPHTVIVPLDGSQFAERAIPVARALATQTDGDVALLTARWDDKPGVALSYLQRTAEAQGPAELDVRPGPACGGSHHARGAGGRRSHRVHDESRSRGLALVCPRQRGRRCHPKAHHPVLLVGRHCKSDWPRGFATAVVCVDGFNVADPIVPVAAEWSKALGLDVHVVLIIHPLDVEGATHPDKTVEAIVAEFQAQGVAARSVVLRSRLIAGEIADYAATVSRRARDDVEPQPYWRRASRTRKRRHGHCRDVAVSGARRHEPVTGPSRIGVGTAADDSITVRGTRPSPRDRAVSLQHEHCGRERPAEGSFAPATLGRRRACSRHECDRRTVRVVVRVARDRDPELLRHDAARA